MPNVHRGDCSKPLSIATLIFSCLRCQRGGTSAQNKFVLISRVEQQQFTREEVQGQQSFAVIFPQHAILSNLSSLDNLYLVRMMHVSTYQRRDYNAPLHFNGRSALRWIKPLVRKTYKRMRCGYSTYCSGDATHDYDHQQQWYSLTAARSRHHLLKVHVPYKQNAISHPFPFYTRVVHAFPWHFGRISLHSSPGR